MDKDKQDKLGISDKTLAKHVEYINPLSLAITEEFDAKTAVGNYRDRAIKRCIDAEVSFVSEQNSIMELVKKLITVKNPVTGKPMTCKGAGGSGGSMTMDFSDDTGMKISITFQHESIGVTFPEKKK